MTAAVSRRGPDMGLQAHFEILDTRQGEALDTGEQKSCVYRECNAAAIREEGPRIHAGARQSQHEQQSTQVTKADYPIFTVFL